ncbi:hypothetical protein CK203_115119 [Vitis vinifera]|uniref:Reverse transcriptase domain-containing protein n=1 Tax=Vitis vinifera TaxID=29760 RepID=A0A438C3T9_VITVI|nr:hypothetical protein CK203_115119 [Vitis vinifera]
MASIQEAIANLGQRIDGQTQQVPVQEDTQFDTTVPPPPHSQPHRLYLSLHSQTEKLRQMRTSEGAITWEDFDGAPVASLPAKFRMPEIERYTGIGCPRIHLRLYSTRWFASLEVSRRRTWDDLAQEFLRQFAFNTVIDVSRRELEALRQRPGALYGIEEGIARGLWSESSPTDSKGKRPSGGQRSGDVGAISSAGMRPSRRYQTVGQTPGLLSTFTSCALQTTCSFQTHDSYLSTSSLTACFCCTRHREASCPIYSTPSSTDHYLCAEATTSVCSVGYAFESSFSEAHRGWIIDPLASRPLPQPIPPRFRMDLHCSYHQGPGHDTDHCTALRHAIQDLIDRVCLIPDEAPFQLTHPTPLVIGCQDTFVPFTLWPEDDDSEGREIQIVTRSGRIAQPPPPAVRPFEGTASHEEVRREDDEVLRQLQSTQARISIWSLLASSSTHRDALIRALSQIRVETTTTPEGLIHMMTAGRATCIVFSDDDLPPDALNVCPLATAIALGFAPSDFGPSTQTVRAYDSTKREVMGTLMIDLQIGPATFSTLFQVLRIPTSFNLLLGRPWIHVAGAIPSSLHQKYFRLVTVRTTYLTGFTFDEIQTLEIEDFHRDFVAMSFDQHSSTVVLDMMRGMTFLPGMGLGRRQQGPSEFIAAIDHDTTFGLGFIPTEADYRHMALRKERVRGLSHTPFDYPIRPYRMSLADYFVRGSETRPRLEEIDSVVHTDRETELQHLFHQLQLSDGAPDTSFPMTITPTSPDRASICSHDEYRDEMDMMTGTQTLPVPELPEDDSSLFEGIVSPVEGADSFDHDSGPIDERVSPAAGDVETVDFGTEDQPRELKIGSPLSTDERDRLIHLLRSYLDVFAWSYEDMPGKEEIQKQLSVGFISVVEYPEWLANVVPVPKKDGKVRVCHSMLSFMDGFSGYNQILMAPEDMEKTAFITEWGMSRFMDDMIVKSRGRADHLDALERFFERIRKFRLRLNPKKCTFGVTSGKLLGIWSVSGHRGRPR